MAGQGSTGGGGSSLLRPWAMHRAHAARAHWLVSGCPLHAPTGGWWRLPTPSLPKTPPASGRWSSSWPPCRRPHPCTHACPRPCSRQRTSPRAHQRLRSRLRLLLCACRCPCARRCLRPRALSPMAAASSTACAHHARTQQPQPQRLQGQQQPVPRAWRGAGAACVQQARLWQTRISRGRAWWTSACVPCASGRWRCCSG